MFTGGVALAVLVAALGALDDRRAEGKLAVLSGEVCDVPLPPRLLAPLDRLFDPARRERANSRAIVERLEARLATDRPVRLYFETEAALWSVTRWEEASRNGAFSWPPSLGRWEELAWSSGCHGEVDGP
ncbi:MAG TPA: hypothetical protein VLA66_00275, partial [Thermoanaerobaculia bacterium]|nr:hypothetical protein [Thermoanaerobaculia bacterium]